MMSVKTILGLAAFLFFYAGIGTTRLTGAEEEKRIPIELPLTIEIRGNRSLDLTLELSNTSNETRSLKSNVPPILDSLFLGFPTEGSLQFKSVSGKAIKLITEHSDGWWWPSALKSAVDINKNRALKDIVETKVKANSSQAFPIKLDDVLRLAMTDLTDDKGESPRKFRVKIQLLVEIASGEKITVDVISGWIPFQPSAPN